MGKGGGGGGGGLEPPTFHSGGGRGAEPPLPPLSEAQPSIKLVVILTLNLWLRSKFNKINHE